MRMDKIHHVIMQNMTCPKCKVEAKRRIKPPRTASDIGPKFFNYYQCPKCRVNYGKSKWVK